MRSLAVKIEHKWLCTKTVKNENTFTVLVGIWYCRFSYAAYRNYYKMKSGWVFGSFKIR